jgi:TetR/AcrR family transcriptional regulator, mexJK operon transcriptional repressor
MLQRKTTHVIFHTMDSTRQAAATSIHKIGRPRRGTESARTDILINAATRVFLRDGYGPASIDKVAAEAGVSTRTIYERFKNKGDLLAAVITRLLDRDMETVFATPDLDRLDPKEALTVIAQSIAGRACDPDSAALFRIVATEAQRFPELAEKMRDGTKQRMENEIANYFRGQIQRGTLALAEPDRAAALFLQMICGVLHECLLFRGPDAISNLDLTPHLNHVIQIFLFGSVPRADRPLTSANPQ